jgi:hypothetical protein
MILKKIFDYLLIITLLVIVSPLISFGQATPGTMGSFLEMTMSPQNPEPFQTVTITIKSFSYDLDRSKITWLVDGVQKKTEMGLKEFTAQAGKNGQKTTVKAVVETPNDGTKEIEAFFIPSVVDLIYESLSYTPPFYKGRALNPNQGMVLVVAIPELINSAGQKAAAQNVIYSWKKDGKVEQSASGLGKNTFVFSGSVPIRDALIEVTASSLDGSIFASKQVTITNVTPQIVFYENSPIYGMMMNKAIVNPVQMLVDEFSILAVPYFFSVGYATTPDLDYAWSLNGQTVSSQDPKNSFTTRTGVAGSGTANIGLKISNNVRVFQFATNNYTINFTKQ